MTFKEKAENFWYHNKFGVFLVLFIIALIVLIIWSYSGKTTYDLKLVYFSNYVLPDGTSEKVEESFRENGLIQDVTEDGEANFYMESIVRTFVADEYLDEATQAKIQTVIVTGDFTLMLAHEYALTDYAQYFEDISDRVRKGDKTFVNPEEGYVSGISVEGNTYLESLGIKTDDLYVAMRRRHPKDIEKGKDKEFFDGAYKVMDYILSHNIQK